MGFMDFLLLMIPSILLCIPSDTIKNSRVIGIICTIGLIITIIILIFCIMDVENIIYDSFSYYYIYHYSFYSNLVREATLAYILQIIYALINIVASLMFFVPTTKNNSSNISQATSTPVNDANKDVLFCKYCGAKIDKTKNVTFCSNCGKKIE